MARVVTCDSCGAVQPADETWAIYEGKDLCLKCYRELTVEIKTAFNNYMIKEVPGP